MPASDKTDSTGFRLRDVAVPAYGPSLLYGISSGAVAPVVALSAVQRGASVAVAGLVVALMGIGSIVANIPAGVLTSRFGERRVMVGATGLTVAGLGLCLLDAGLWPFAAGVLVLGMSGAVFQLARQSYLTEIVPFGRRARAMSTLGGVVRIGAFAGAFAGAGAIALGGLPGAYVLALAAIVGSGAIVYALPDLAAGDAAPSPVSTVAIVRDHWRTLATLGAGVALLSAIRQTRQVVVPLWAEHLHLDPGTASLLFGVSGVVEALVFYPSGLVMDRWGRRAIAVPCTLVMGLGFLVLPLTHSAVTLGVVAVVIGVGNGFGSGINNTLGADSAPLIGRPTFLGVWRELSDGGASLGPVILSAVTGLAGLAGGIVVSGLVGVLAAAVLYRYVPRRPLLADSQR
ncbi:MFS transporter [Actinoplanes sp. RD1]|uniref:MFS transporter n=1 Tax=Actinoplanes sp. RD1 TaxID=3064538 RepID=UPI0027410658|nr:MFS transporter [Actinoplanes sp. RD1]